MTATKGENTVRLAPPANHIAYIDAPTATAMVGKDAEAPRTVDGPTV